MTHTHARACCLPSCVIEAEPQQKLGLPSVSCFLAPTLQLSDSAHQDEQPVTTDSDSGAASAKVICASELLMSNSYAAVGCAGPQACVPPPALSGAAQVLQNLVCRTTYKTSCSVFDLQCRYSSNPIRDMESIVRSDHHCD